MEKIVRVWICVLLVFFCFVPGALGATQPAISLQLDGQALTSDVPPTLQSSRVLLPGRAIFEALNGQVDWDGKTKTTDISINNTNIRLVNNSKIALVNQEKVELDVPAQIIAGRTMLPLRFVAEKSGCTVDWDNTKKLVTIKSSGQTEKPETPDEIEKPIATAEVSAIKFNTKSGANQLVVVAKSVIADYQIVDNSGNSLVLDITKAKLPITPKTVTINHPLFVSLAMKQQSTNTVRVTVQLKQGAEGTASLSADKKTLTVDFGSIQDQTVSNPQPVAGLPTLSPDAIYKLVVIDAGHGGSDPGSSGTFNGVKLEEGTINLKVAQRTNQLLQQAGVRTYMIRSGDESIATKNRPIIANVIGADMFVSIHNNAFDKASANGTETLWYDGKKNSESTYGITSKRLAEIAQKQLTEKLGLTNRGIKERSGLVVLNSTKMPAFLMEGAFLSNGKDFAFMQTDEFVEQFAMAAAYTTIQGLNESVD